MNVIALSRSPYAALSPLALATVVVAALDLVEVSAFYALYQGVPPIRIGQSIASGLIGADAYRGGLSTAFLGVALHTAIMGVIVGVYAFGAARLPALARRWFVAGMAYGLAVYVVMNAVVVPLSAAVVGARSWPVVVNGLAAHLFAVGVPIAWCVARVRRQFGASP
ncbi:hypothetical protein [Tahibacter soli]|uniref:Uncharacterized protein n=1 Tax=Tahibacter soli TaxID=2983605 RepID=A0A9X3YQ34_9GAMM|nr:hypothetical protein [Tahibacter soli]MDC8014828.1 hypothetical protein [Tahibacter soli]